MPVQVIGQIELKLDSQLCMSEEVQIIVDTDIDIASFNWTGPSINDAGQINAIIGGAGTYTLTIIPSDNSNAQVATIEILDIPVEEFSITSNSIITCTNRVSTLTTSIIDTSLYTYMWLSENGVELGTSPSLDASFAGMHTLEITNELGCTRSSSVEVIADIPVHDFVITLDSLTCDEVGQLSISSEDDIIAVNWIGPLNFRSSEQDPSISVVGFYEAEVTFSDSCQVVKSIRADYFHFAPDVDFTGEVINCDSPEIIPIENTNPNYSYQWRCVTGTFNSEEAEPSLDERGFYEVKVKDLTGCEAIYYTNVRIDTVTAKFVIISEQLNCGTLSTVLDYNFNTNNFRSFEWTGPGINNNNKDIEKPTTSQEGIYSINGITNNGCPFERTGIVTKDIEPINITNGGSSTIINCIDTEQTLTVSTDRDAEIYQWFFDGNIISNEQTIQADEAGEYQVLAFGSNQCMDRAFYEVTSEINPPLIMDNSATTINCKDSIAQVDIAIIDSAGGTDFSYNWSTDNANGTVPQDLIFETTQAGNYFLRSEDLNNNCIRIDTITITEDKAMPVVELRAGSINCGQQEALVEIISETADLSFNWTTETGQIDNVSEIITDGSSDIILQTTGSNFCITTDIITIEQDTVSPNFGIITNDPLGCIIRDITLNAETVDSLEFLYEWSTSDGSISGDINDNKISIDLEGVYTLTATNPNNNCIGSKSISLEPGESMLRNIEIENLNPRCSNDTNGQIIIASIEGAVGALSYALNDEDVFQSDPIFNDLQDGEYLIKLIDESGCTFDTITRLEAGNIIELEAIDTITVDESESVTISTILNQSGQEISYQWIGLNLESVECDTCDTITFDAFESQILTVVGTDENGCEDKAEIEITVNELSDLWIANVFSPSVSNFRNKILPIYFAPFVRSVESIRSYDRYGNNIVSLIDMNPENINVIWDGRYNGKLVENGVYTFVIQYTLDSGDSFTVTRNVTVIQ